MYQFRAKTIQIEAFQLNVTPPPMWFIEAMEDGRARRRPEPGFDICTNHGFVVAKPTDFILRHMDGELGAMRMDVFARKFEPVPFTNTPRP